MALWHGRTDLVYRPSTTFSPKLKLSASIVMNELRQRYDAVKLADNARNALLEDLLRKVDSQQKTMDRNAFALVLIDGDCMNVSILGHLDHHNTDIVSSLMNSSSMASLAARKLQKH